MASFCKALSKTFNHCACLSNNIINVNINQNSMGNISDIEPSEQYSSDSP